MKLKRILSLLLSLMMLIGMMPTMTSAETELNFSGTQASISKITSGQLSLSTLSLYKGSDKNAALPIVSVTQNESTFNVVLESDTELPLTIGYSFNAGSPTPTGYTLSGRTGSQEVTVTGSGMGPNPAMWPRIKVTFNFSLAEGASYPVTMPSDSAGFTVSGDEKVYEGNSYSFTVNVNEGYDGSAMIVTVNGEIITAENGVFTIDNVCEALEIAVSGVVAKEQYEVVLNSGDGYTVSSTDTPYKGEDYTFRVTVDNDNYKIGSGGIKVLINSEENKAVDNGDGTYTIPALDENKSVTVSGVIERELFEVLKSNVPGVTFNGADAVREGKDYTFTLSVDSSYNAVDMAVTDENGGTVVFSNGKYTIANVSTAPKIVITGVVPKQLIEVTLPVVNGLVIRGESGAFEGESYTFTVSEKNGYSAENIVVTVNGTPLNGSNGTYTIENVTAAPQISITATVNKLPGDVTINKVTGKGSLNYIAFSDADGNPIEGIDSDLNGTEISVILPKDYALDGKVRAVFDLTDENNDGYPFVSTSSKTTGNGAYSSRFTENQFALTNGAATFVFYYYNNSTSATNNGGQTKFTISFKIKNDKPVLADGIAPTANATVTAGENYTLDLSPLFTDADEDALTYKVSVNGTDAVEADANYTFTTDVAGTYTLVFNANDSKDDSADTYTVRLTVENSSQTDSMTVCVPEGLTPTFYVASGFADSIDITGASLEALQGVTSDGMTAYTINYPVNAEMLSVRTEDFGGMAFTAEKDGRVSLRKAQFKVVDYANNDAVSTNKVTYGGNTAVSGTDGWLLVAGNEYVFTATPQNADLTPVSKTLRMEAGADIYIASIMLGIKNPMSITVPTGAKAQLYKYNQYYSNTEREAKIITDNGDGTATYQFIADTKNETGFIYRVSMEGKITKAGWVGWNEQNLTVTYTENDKAPSYRLNDYSATGEENSALTEDSVLLNANSRNHLNLSVGQSKTLKAYRAWEIIPVSYNNYIIPPDFKFNILHGDDVIELTEKASPSACDGDWMTLTALKSGIAIIEVAYDAIDIRDTGTTVHYSGVYGASDSNRTGLLIVQVGENDDSSVKFGIDSFTSIGKSGDKCITYNPDNKKEWDAEFDTLYFLGNSGSLTLKPTASTAVFEVAVSHDKGASWTALSGENGTYTAEIVPGNNIIRVTTESGTAYQVVRGDKITVKLAEVEDKSNKNDIIEAGETVRVHLIGLHTPIPKMAGNYNPGYGGNTDGYSSQHLNYTCNGNAIYGTGKQYEFITQANYVDVVMPDDGSDIVLSDGYIGVGVMGLTTFFDGGDSHRNIPDSGCGTRGSQSTFHTRSILPEIIVSVGDTSAPNAAPTVRANAVTEAEIYLNQNFAINPDTLFTDPDGDTMTFTVSVNGAQAADAPVDYKFVPDSEGTYTLLFTAADGTETVQHTVTLTVTRRSSQGDSDSKDDDFDISESEIAGYVTISFVDKGVRVAGESGLKFPTPLGTIIKATMVPYKEGDKITHVTKRLLDSLEIGMSFSGTLESNFYLGAICNFEVKGTPYASMGEFDAGAGSGWMITLNKEFIEYGASEFEVKNGDVIKWQYTCQLGADIGDPFYSETSSSKKNNKNEKEETKTEDISKDGEEKQNAPFTETTFADVKKDNWHYEYVKYVYERGLMQGTGNGFEPDGNMSRAMLVTVLYRMANPQSNENKHSFSDVPKGQWYSDAIAWASANGIVNGVSKTEFAPDSDISREQMALIIYRFAKMQGYDANDKADISNFRDTDDVSDWALDAFKWTNKKELINGTSETTLSPKAMATRAQVAAIIMRLCETLAK